MMSYRQRIKALRKTLHEKKLDALIVFTNEDRNKNLRYLSGFGGSFGALLVTRQGSFLATDGRYLARARKEAPFVGLVAAPHERRDRHNTHVVTHLIREAQLKPSARIGFESHRIPFATAAAWRLEVTAKLAPVEFLVERLRQYKDEEEIAAIRKACRMTDAVFRSVVPRIRAGMREREVAAMLNHEHRRRGAAGPSFPTIVASGPNSAIPHHETGSRKLLAGEPVVMDFGAVVGGYCSDITRTIFVGGKRPDPKLVEIYTVVRVRKGRARRGARAGMTWRDYDRGPAREYIESKGYGKQFLHSLGHSLGLDVHDPFDYANDTILPGTVLTDEPGIYIEGLGGVRIEDDLLMTKKGAVRLTRAPYWDK